MRQITLEEAKKALSDFSNEICDIPEDFDIHGQYLGLIPKERFIAAFKALRDIMADMISDAADNPEAYGISHLDKQGGDALHKEFSYLLNFEEKLIQPIIFLKKLCESSAAADCGLSVDMPSFLEAINTYPKIKKPDMMVERLKEKGFKFEGYSKSLKKTDKLTVSHAKNPDIVIAAWEYTDREILQAEFLFDYSHFNYKLLAVEKNAPLDLKDLYVYSSLSEAAREFLLSFNAYMNENGYSYGENAISGLFWGRSQFAYSKHPESGKGYVARLFQRGGSLAVRLFLRQVHLYEGYIENSPAFIKDIFISDAGNCNHCKVTCSHRKTYTIDGKQYEKCDGEVFFFNDISTDAVSHYTALINLSASKGRSVGQGKG